MLHERIADEFLERFTALAAVDPPRQPARPGDRDGAADQPRSTATACSATSTSRASRAARCWPAARRRPPPTLAQGLLRRADHRAGAEPARPRRPGGGVRPLRARCSTFRDDAEALAIANGTDYGLGSGLWTRDLQRAHRFARELHAGMVWINSYKRVNPGSPFGGVGQSGYGREMGFDAMREYTQVKSVWVNVDARSRPGTGAEGRSFVAPFVYTAQPSRVVFGAGSLRAARRRDRAPRRDARARALDAGTARASAERVADAARRARRRRLRAGA